MNEELTPLNDPPQQGNALLSDLRQIIRSGKSQAVAAVNSALTLTFWHVGKRINEEVLQGERAAYAKKVIPSLARELVERFGKSFEAKSLHRIMQLAAAPELAGAFKDPYFSDSLSLPDGYLENKLGNNLEQALSRELEQFILELGKGFAFVERQKQMIFP
jgi:DUF1016 N-terminal domain/YhcG PDDEXK nuclease domain